MYRLGINNKDIGKVFKLEKQALSNWYKIKQTNLTFLECLVKDNDFLLNLNDILHSTSRGNLLFLVEYYREKTLDGEQKKEEHDICVFIKILINTALEKKLYKMTISDNFVNVLSMLVHPPIRLCEYLTKLMVAFMAILIAGVSKIYYDVLLGTIKGKKTETTLEFLMEFLAWGLGIFIFALFFWWYLEWEKERK